jgi:hypothetical protein
VKTYFGWCFAAMIFERSERLGLPADEPGRVVSVTLALERHLRVTQVHLTALQRAETGLPDSAQKREREDVVEVLAQRVDEGLLLGLARFALRRFLLGDTEPEIGRQECSMMVPHVVKRGAQRLHGAVDRRVRHQLFLRTPLVVLAGASLRCHQTPLVADLGDFFLRNVVEERVGAENAFDPGQFPCGRRFVGLATGDFAHIEFGRPPERHRLAAAFDLGIDLPALGLVLLLRYLERASSASFARRSSKLATFVLAAPVPVRRAFG